MSARIIRGEAFEDSGVSLMGRIRGHDGENIVQADLSSIAYSVFDVTNPASVTAGGTGTLTIADVVYDTLQTDSRWTKDSVGFNFLWPVAATHFASGGKTYRFEVAFTPASGAVFHGVWEVVTTGLERS